MVLQISAPTYGATSGYDPAQDYRPSFGSICNEAPSVFSSSGVAARLQVDLDNVMMDCHAPGWDGHGAEPVSTEAYRAAQRFLGSLPSGFPPPVLSADPYGCVTFEWRTSPRCLVLVSVHPDYRIDYAAVFGKAKTYGSEPFFTVLPNMIRDLVGRLTLA